MNTRIPFKDADKLKLQKLYKREQIKVYLFLGITLMGSIIIGLFLTYFPEKGWAFIATPFVLLFAVGTSWTWHENYKKHQDIQAGIKDKISGVIARKQISVRRKNFTYNEEMLAMAIKRVEEEEAGKPITRYGVVDNEIDGAANQWYGVEIEGKSYNVGVRDFLKVKEGDTIELEIAPRSKVVLSTLVKS
jgi:hypothetical protein